MVALSSLGGGGSSGAGSPKVFFNGTLTAADLTGLDTFTLFTNNATTTSVIESVTVDETVGLFDINGAVVTASFVNDGTDIGDVIDLGGSEITAPSTSLTIKLDTPLVLKNFDYYAEGTKDVMCVSSSNVSINELSHAGVIHQDTYATIPTTTELIVNNFYPSFNGVRVQSNDTQSVPSMIEPRWYYSTGNHAYYFFCDGNSNTRLYHATITAGTVGAWSIVDDSNYAYKALDLGKKKVFYTYNGEFYQCDLTTNTVSQLGASDIAEAISSNSTAGAANGVFFYVPTAGDTNSVHYYDTNDGTYGSINFADSYSITTNSHLGVCYNPAENKFYLSIGATTISYVYSIAWADKSATFLGIQNTVYPADITYMYAMLGNDNGEMFINSKWAALQIIKFENDKATVQEDIATINGSTDPTQQGTWYRDYVGTKQTVTLAATDYEINIKCKISGAEYKEG
jgi:hypothetical protein